MLGFPATTSDHVGAVLGVALTAANGSQRTAVARLGATVSFISDGSGPISAGDRLMLSPTLPGRVCTATTVRSVGVALEAAVATVDAVVTGVFSLLS